MFETLFGTELPLPARFVVAFLIVLGLIGVMAWLVRRLQPFRHFQPYDREARRLGNLPLVISLFAFALSLYALVYWSVGYGASPLRSSNLPDLADAGTDAARAVLYEEDPDDPQGRRLAGSTTWRTDDVAAAGKLPDLSVVAEVDIPERGMGMTWTLRRDTDPNSPASHTIEIMFRVPPDFPPGGILKVPGIWMKQAEQTQGAALAGLGVNVATGYFLIGLSSAPADRERNIQLLKERAWFDIPFIYTNNRRAILAMEKRAAGERAFTAAFNTWEAVPSGVK